MKAFLTISLILFLSLPIFSQDLRQKAEENPLDTARYLVATEDASTTLLREIAFYYWSSNRYTDAVSVVELLSVQHNERTTELVRYAQEFLKIGKKKAALQLLVVAGRSFDNGIYEPANELIGGLIEADKADEAIKFASSAFEDPEDKASALLQIAELQIKKGETERALELLPGALALVETSEWRDDKLMAAARAANIYAQAGQDARALELIKQVQELFPTTSEALNSDQDKVYDLIVSCYAKLRQFDMALHLLGSRIDYTDEHDVYKLAQLNLLAGNAERARVLALEIEQLSMSNAASPGHEAYLRAQRQLKQNDLLGALASAKEVDFTTTQMRIVAEFIARNREDLARELLAAMDRRVQSIRTDEPETGRMSISGQMQKAGDLADIASKFGDLKQFSTALNIIEKIQKPYFKAAALADLAQKQRSAKSFHLLDRAIVIMRKNEDSSLDARKYHVWGVIALAFSSLGNKKRALDTFVEILSKDKELTDERMGSEVLGILAETGYYFEKADVRADARVRSALKDIITKWQLAN